ncbi:MAG: autotransporter outer membrane beta-barrel domain-containing protein [Pararobbsia sp.]
MSTGCSAARSTGAVRYAWYLRSSRQEPPPPAPPEPTPPAPPTPFADVVVPLFRPEIGAYLANQRLAVGFLVHSLHDRLGEPQWTEQQTFDNDDAQRDAGWVRVVGKDIGSRSSNGAFDVQSTAWMLQMGGDVARWSMLRGDDRMHVGGMLGYNWGSSTGQAIGNPFSAKSDLQGVNVGVYGTWFQNDKSRLGWYTDFWAQYGWFTNEVDGQFLSPVNYDSQVLALSAEAGYAWLPSLEHDWVIEPQAQVIYVHAYQGAFNEPTGTRVEDVNGDGVITRLGVRVHRTWIDSKGRRYQPYVTLNWWHDTVANDVALNQVTVSDLYPSNRYETKLGFDVQGTKGWTGWTNVGWQWGAQSYHAFIGRLGAKYTW